MSTLLSLIPKDVPWPYVVGGLLVLAIALDIWRSLRLPDPKGAQMSKFRDFLALFHRHPKPVPLAHVTEAPPSHSMPPPVPTPVPVAPVPVAALPSPWPSTPAPAPPAPPAVPPAVAPVGSPGLRVDPVVPPGTPGTVTLTTTGHTLSVPQKQNGEGLLGYALRTHLQTGGDPNTVGGLLVAGSALGATGDQITWPLAIDKYFNPVVYETPAQHAQDQQTAAAWAEVEQRIANQGPPATPRTPA